MCVVLAVKHIVPFRLYIGDWGIFLLLYLRWVFCQVFFFLFLHILVLSWNNFRFWLSFSRPQKLSNDLAFQYFYLIYDIVLYWYLDTKLCNTCFLIVNVVFIDAHVLFCKYWYKFTRILSLEKNMHCAWPVIIIAIVLDIRNIIIKDS